MISRNNPPELFRKRFERRSGWNKLIRFARRGQEPKSRFRVEPQLLPVASQFLDEVAGRIHVVDLLLYPLERGGLREASARCAEEKHVRGPLSERRIA